jgi:hypothetical protein
VKTAILRSGVGRNGLAQAVSSLSNVVISLMVAHQVSASSFGSFSVVASTFVLACGLGRAILGEPILALHASADRRQNRGIIGAAMSCGAVLGCCVGAAAFALASGVVREMLLVLSLTLPLLLLEDVCRYICFASGKPLRACGLDLVWLLLAITGIVAVGGQGGVLAFAAIWLVSGCVAGLVGWLIVEPRMPSGGWKAAHWLLPLGGRYGVEYLTSGALAALPVYVLALWATPSDVGGFRAAQTLLGPANVAFAAIATYFVPLANSRRISTDEVRRGAKRMAVGVSSLVLIWVVLLVAMPARWLATLVGDSAQGAERCLPALGVAAVLLAVGGGAVVAHRALRAASTSLRVRLLLAPVGLLLPVLCGISGGLDGVLAAVVIFALLSAVVWWVSLLRLDQGVQGQPVMVG